MTDTPLLPTGHTIGSGIFNGQKLFTADQMRAYGAACAAAEREACAKVCEALWDKQKSAHPSYCSDYEQGALDGIDAAEQAIRARETP